MARTQGSPQLVELGHLLRHHRQQVGKSQQTLAGELGISHSDVSRRETGRQGLTKEALLAHLDALDVVGADRDFAVALHGAVTSPNAVSGVQRPLAMLSQYEDAARKIVNVQPALIPGPLQTRDWAVEMGIQNGMSLAEAQRGADFRMARSRKIFSRGTEYEAIIGEFALRHPACGPDVAAAQWARLLELIGTPGLTIRVVPIQLGYTALRLGPFVLLELPQMKVAYLEGSSSSTTLTDPRYVAGYQKDADSLRDVAMSATATEALIARLINNRRIPDDQTSVAQEQPQRR